MNPVIDQERFTDELFALLEETFETHHGIYLDKGTSLFETLESITAAEASCPGDCSPYGVSSWRSQAGALHLEVSRLMWS